MEPTPEYKTLLKPNIKLSFFHNFVAFSRDGTRIATSLAEDGIRVWDAASMRMILGPIKNSVDSIEFSPDS